MTTETQEEDRERELESVQRCQAVANWDDFIPSVICNHKEMKLRYSDSLNTIHRHGLRFCLDGQHSSSSAMERSRRKLNLMMSYGLCHVQAFSLSSNTNGSNNVSSDATCGAYKQSGDLPQDSEGDYEDSDGDKDFGNAFDLVEVQVEKTGKNRRRIQSRISVKASLERVWNILTDYERLAEFIPGLAVSQLLEKKDNIARLFQIGQQNLAFGLKFEAKGVIECYEGDLENFPLHQRRDIDFKMIKGDFQLFEGTWSIEQMKSGEIGESNLISGEELRTTLFYVVDVEPKVWLPVRLVEGRLCREIKMNLLSIKRAAEDSQI